ncbi:MAG: hypothetical protein ACE5G3_06310 [Gammaproteobacteria bacterium]
MSDAGCDLLRRFERGEIEPASFGHRDHVKVACEMLGQYDFVDACTRYTAAIRAMAESAGAPQKFNATITFAFMSLIAERKSRAGSADVDSFLASNPDLLDKNLLRRWYSEERLVSQLAREQFLLPDKGVNLYQSARDPINNVRFDHD